MEISIKKPCHENWEAMTQNEQGAFCNMCSKTVVDFSSMPLSEIHSFFLNRKTEKVCGRFEEGQLSSLSFDAFFRSFQRFTLSKRIAVIIYFTFGLCLFNVSDASGQNSPHLKGDVEVVQSPIMGGVKVRQAPIDTLPEKDKHPRMMKGKVKVSQKPRNEYKLGEVMAEPPKPKNTRNPKKK